MMPAAVVVLAQIRCEWINFVQGDSLHGVMAHVPWKLTSPERATKQIAGGQVGRLTAEW
jgi:hypothetical protein